MGFNKIFLIGLLACSVITDAQILRVDKNHLESDSSGYFNCSADINYSLDNRSISTTERLVYTRLSERTDLLYVSKNTAYILVNSIEYFKSTNASPFSTGYVHGRVNFFRRHKVSMETFGQIQYDGVRRLRLRELLGVGGRLTLIDKSNVDIHVGTGLMYEWEKWRAIEGDPNSDFYKGLLKSTSYLGIEFDFSSQTKLTLWGLNQIGFDREDDIWRSRYAGEATFSIRIARRLTWLNRFSYFYDVHPVIAINPDYFQLVNGFKFQF